MSWQSKILSILIDKLENSKHYMSESQKGSKTKLNFSEKQIVKDYHSDDYAKNKAIYDAVLELEQKDFLKVEFAEKYRKGHIHGVTLNFDRIDEIYRTLKRTPKKDYVNESKKIFSSYKNYNNNLDEYLTHINDCLNENRSLKPYFDISAPKSIKEVMDGVIGVIQQNEEIAIRRLSIQLFNDSKRLEEIKGKLIAILRKFEPKLEFVSDNEVLAHYNVLSNPGHVFMKGCGQISINNQVVDLQKLDGSIGLSTKYLDTLSFDLNSVDNLITIENLTSFEEYSSKNELIVYLGGFMNSYRCELLKSIHAIKPDLEFKHWGDIDLGGFRILEHMKRETGIEFHPYFMDTDILIRYEDSLKTFNESYRSKIEQAIQSGNYIEYIEQLEEILRLGGTLEQESIVIG